MFSMRNPDLLCKLQGEIETFLISLKHPVVVEDEVEVFDLMAGQWRLRQEFGKLIFEAWSPVRSMVRRVEEAAYRDRDRMGVFVRKPGGHESATMEFRELERDAAAPRSTSRSRFRQELLAVLQREFPGWCFERVSNRSDREHSFSTWYTRGLARQGRRRAAWAFLGMSEAEPFAVADAALAYGLIWLDWLRGRSEPAAVPGLKLFLPEEAATLAAHRAAYLNPRTVHLEIFRWSSAHARVTPVDLRDFGNVETRLTPCRRGEKFAESLVERHGPLLRGLLDEAFDRLDIIAEPSGAALSLRVKGLEVARVEGHLAPRVYFGLEGSYRKLEEGSRAEFRHFLNRVLELRTGHSQDPSHEFYRLQSERWLESLLLCDLTKIDSALLPDHAYPQVPAFSGPDRGVIDILSVTRAGRLAVIELKLHEEINLPLQGLDYWLRVKWLNERGQFQEFGYFPGVELSKAPPLLYFICPALRFHSTYSRTVRYLDSAVEIVQVGLNDQWREGVKVLFRRQSCAGG